MLWNELMSAEQIPKNYRNITGKAALAKLESAFSESTLERDCLTLLEFDHQVITYDVQPIDINWTDGMGQNRTYTPDFLIRYRKHGCNFSSFDTILCEIKYRSEIFSKWDELKPKFKAAVKYAKEMGWRFKILTEVEIKTDYMENARFLLPYINGSYNDSHAEMLVNKLITSGNCSISELLDSLIKDKWARAELVPTLWQLIGIGRIKTDLNIPITMSSIVSLRG